MVLCAEPEAQHHWLGTGYSRPATSRVSTNRTRCSSRFPDRPDPNSSLVTLQGDARAYGFDQNRRDQTCRCTASIQKWWGNHQFHGGESEDQLAIEQAGIGGPQRVGLSANPHPDWDKMAQLP